MPPMTLTAKQQTRAAHRARRRVIAAERDLRADGVALAGHLEPLIARLGIGPGDVVTAYEHLPHEPHTDAVCRLLAVRGARVIMPITLPSFDLDWFALDDPDRTPLGLDAVARCRLLLIPALSVDALGNRLGQAGGCYDRTLPRATDNAVVVALLHPGELDERPLPTDPWDRPVDLVLTANGLSAVGPDRRRRLGD